MKTNSVEQHATLVFECAIMHQLNNLGKKTKPKL